MIRRARLAALLLGASACVGAEGTITVQVVTSPGSTLLDSVDRVRLSLSDPPTQVEAGRDGDGFALTLTAPADGDPAWLGLEGFDAAGALVAYGRSPSFTVAPLDARVAIFVAPPLSVTAAPTALAAPRFELGTAPLPYGAILAGGRGNDDAARAELEIYNAFDHTLRRGLDLPAPRAAPAVATAIDGAAYLLGGATTDGTAQASAWRFDTTAAPSGAWAELPPLPGARASEQALPLSLTEVLLTGAPVRFALTDGTAVALAGAPTLPRQAAVVATDTGAVALGAGASVVRYRAGVFDELPLPAAQRTGHAVVATADGHFAVLGGQRGDELVRDAVKIDPRTGAATIIADALDVPRRHAATARAGRYIVLAGGVSETGTILASAEVLDAETLAHLATVPLSEPRTAAAAVVLPNEQVLFVGGIDGRGRATALLELFTPRP